MNQSFVFVQYMMDRNEIPNGVSLLVEELWQQYLDTKAADGVEWFNSIGFTSWWLSAELTTNPYNIQGFLLLTGKVNFADPNNATYFKIKYC